MSNIVGNPYALDRLFTLFLGPFPEQNDFNAVLTGIDLSRALVFHGTIPLARYWGLQLFIIGAKKNLTQQTLADFEIIPDSDLTPPNLKYSDHSVQRSSKTYTVVVSSEEYKPSWTKNWVNIGFAHPTKPNQRKCHLVFRGYCPYIGASFSAPQCFLVDPKVLGTYSSIEDFLSKQKEEKIGEKERVFGPWATVENRNSERNRLFETVILNLFFMVILSLFLQDALDLSFLFLSSTILSYFGYQEGLYYLARRRYQTMMKRRYPSEMAATIGTNSENNPKNPQKNQIVLFPDPHGSLAGHPNHQYYTIPYDARQTDIEIRGFRTGPFRYTSVQCYGWDSLPICPFLFDESLVPDSENSNEKESKYVVRLTTKPRYHPQQNIINVASAPSGLCLIRLIYPENDQVIQQYAPSVRPIPRI